VKIVYSPAHTRHAPRSFIRRGVVAPNPEVPERAERLLASAREAGHEIVAPDGFARAALEAVHDKGYLDFLETIHERWRALPGAGEEIVPNVHPNRRMSRRPEGPVGLAGYYVADTGTPIVAGTWDAIAASAHTALHAAEMVLAGERAAYALCRPPGHHAYADMAGGFCYLNNAAIAAERVARRSGRVAILDIDVHHGNGTQGIFYDRGDVFFASLHADPADYYPFYAGHAEERGTGAGEGANLNLPLAHGTGDDGWLAALDTALDAIRGFAPNALVVSLGFDASEKDPLGVLRVTTGGFAEAARRIAALGSPTVLVQEGGYVSDELGRNLAHFLAAFERAGGEPRAG
jgi:acetoin utilization deacetylase AcuC-like enzyme